MDHPTIWKFILGIHEIIWMLLFVIEIKNFKKKNFLFKRWKQIGIESPRFVRGQEQAPKRQKYIDADNQILLLLLVDSGQEVK